VIVFPRAPALTQPMLFVALPLKITDVVAPPVEVLDSEVLEEAALG
jgi:hypothetical protein